MAMSADRLLTHDAIIVENRLPVKGAAVLYLGAMVSSADGYLAPAALVGQDNRAIYIALEQCDATGLADGVARCRVMTRGTALIPKGALTQADCQLTVYATDDNTLTTVANVRPVGVLDYIDGSLAAVRIG